MAFLSRQSPLRTAWRCAALLCTLVCVAASAQEGKTRRAEAAEGGRKLFVAYCASCHGTDARGAGTVAPSLKTFPADLTALARENNGKFPRERVTLLLRGDLEKPVHGSKAMPVWGPVFLAESGADQNEVERRIRNLVQYLESIQSGIVVQTPQPNDTRAALVRRRPGTHGCGR